MSSLRENVGDVLKASIVEALKKEYDRGWKECMEYYWKKENQEEEEWNETKKLLSTKIVDMDSFSVRSMNCLHNARIETLEDLVQLTQQELLKYKNFGRKSVGEIRKVLSDMGLQFGMTLDDDEK